MTDTHPQETDSEDDFYHRPDEFGILRDIAGRARAPDGCGLRASEGDIAEILAMTHGSENMFCQQQAIAQPSIERTVPPSLDDNLVFGT